MCKSQNFQCVTVTEPPGTIGRDGAPRLCKQKESSFERGAGVREERGGPNIPSLVVPREGQVGVHTYNVYVL